MNGSQIIAWALAWLALTAGATMLFRLGRGALAGLVVLALTLLEVALYVSLTSDIQKTLSERFPLEKVTSELSQKFDQLFEGFDAGGPSEPSD